MRKTIMSYAAESMANKPQGVTIQLSLEGLFDGILGIFKQSAKEAETPFSPDHRLNSRQWQSKLKDALMSTLGNPKWVKAHLKENQSVSSTVAKGLSFKGHAAPTPAGVVENYSLLLGAYVRGHYSDMKAYGAALQKIQRELDKSPKTEEGNRQALAKAKSDLHGIKFPFHDKYQTPEGYGGRSAMLQGRKVVVSTNAQSLNDQPLKTLTVEEVVQGTKKLLEFAQVLSDAEDLWQEFGGFLNGMDEGFWRRDDVEYIDGYKFVALCLHYEEGPHGQYEMFTHFHQEGWKVAQYLLAWLRSAIKEQA